jgi:hypothetical protein
MKSSKAKSPRVAGSKSKVAKTTANGVHATTQDVSVSTEHSNGNGIGMAATAAPGVAPTVFVALPDSPTLEEVRMRAYELYLERGAAPGGELHDWIRAERELSEARARP